MVPVIIIEKIYHPAEVPYHNYTYAGSYHDILKMYYGIISSLLTIGYQMEHDEGTLQYEIVYCVDFESTSKLHSDMYILSDMRYDKRFVVFHLPFEAFTDIETTVKLLIHEVFHYIAPFSRKNRNKLLLEIWSVSVFNRMLKLLFGKYKNLDSNIFNVDDIEVGWLERRLGLIIDIFYGDSNAGESYQKFSEETRKSASEYEIYHSDNL